MMNARASCLLRAARLNTSPTSLILSDYLFTYL
jgi:hypothetical protein